MTLEPLIRRGLLTLPPETAHGVMGLGLRGLDKLRLGGLLPTLASQPTHCMGLTFANPIGLAAGFDKSGDLFNALGAFGFGFIEVGTVTPRPQPGNPKPRLFRLPQHQALFNRMGFNNKGVDHLVKRLKKRRYPGILGINIGKNADTPLAQAVDDYRICFTKVCPYADYVTINISSPNTQGLRQLQTGQYLLDLMNQLTVLRDQQSRRIPLLLKLTVDLDQPGRDFVWQAVSKSSLDGLILTNTTVDQSFLPKNLGQGGISGLPLRQSAQQMMIEARQQLPSLSLVGSGGLLTAHHVAQRLQAGANLVQLYSGFIYHGAELLHAINELAPLSTKDAYDPKSA